jgi:hypothetical protein
VYRVTNNDKDMSLADGGKGLDSSGVNASNYSSVLGEIGHLAILRIVASLCDAAWLRMTSQLTGASRQKQQQAVKTIDPDLLDERGQNSIVWPHMELTFSPANT